MGIMMGFGMGRGLGSNVAHDVNDDDDPHELDSGTRAREPATGR